MPKIVNFGICLFGITDFFLHGIYFRGMLQILENSETKVRADKSGSTVPQAQPPCFNASLGYMLHGFRDAYLHLHCVSSQIT